MQHFATVDFPWYIREWERYYIQHEAYTQATGNAYEDAIKLNVEEKGELGDSVIALAKALTENNMWQEELGDKIKDPVVQTNALLSKILLTVEAIMQQNNETSIVSVPTSLASLGLGFTNT
jgi:CRISPR/Cas system CMR subunit Cmr4 (Cas7 group RAMP superfamily)